jgi:hypothetical protein
MSEALIRQITDTDYTGLAEFLSAFPGDEKSPEQWQQRFRYWWDDNPAFDESWTRGFVIVDSGLTVGFVGSFPTLFKCGEQIVKAFNGTTWRVLPDYRNLSIELWIKNREISNHVLSFNTTPTDTVIKLISKLNYRLLPWGSEQESLYILNPSVYTHKVFYGWFPIISPLIGVGINLKQAMVRKATKGKYAYKTLPGTDKSFDELWERTKDTFAYTNVRTADSVQWYSKNSILIGIYHEDFLQGYAIATETVINKVKELYMADLWLFPSIELHKAISGLVDFVIGIAKMRNCSMVRFPHFTEKLAVAYKKKGLLHKKINRRNYYRLPSSLQIDFTSDNSYFTLLQGDYGI